MKIAFYQKVLIWSKSAIFGPKMTCFNDIFPGTKRKYPTA